MDSMYYAGCLQLKAAEAPARFRLTGFSRSPKPPGIYARLTPDPSRERRH
jgi:hypothetical protein